MDNGIILFDIDHTIIDTDKLRSHLIEEIIAVTKAIIKCTTGDVAYGILVVEEKMVKSNQRFLMNDLIENLGTYFKSERLKFELANVLSSPDIFSSCLYPDTRLILERLTQHFQTGIFSSGDVFFQKMKLRASGIEPYFRPEHINIMESTSSNIPKIVDKYKRFKLAIVDDRASVIEQARQLRGDIIGIWVDRQKFKHERPTNTEFSPHFQVKDLQSIPQIFNIY
jgi:FMN phosphatase YigB (HAD superfamily)